MFKSDKFFIQWDFLAERSEVETENRKVDKRKVVKKPNPAIKALVARVRSSDSCWCDLEDER